MRSRSNGGVIGAYALPTQNYANGVFFIHDAAIYNTGPNPIWPLGTGFIYSATGGTISTAVDNPNYKLHTFTANGTFTVTTGSAYIDIFLVGGGGAGGGVYMSTATTLTVAGGGGAGGVVTLAQNVWVSSPTTFTVEVGGGGSSLAGTLPNEGVNSGKPSKVTSNQGHSFFSSGGGYGGGRVTSGYYLPVNGGGQENHSISAARAYGGSAPPVGTGSTGTITSNTFDGGSIIGTGVSNRMMGSGGSGATGPGYDNDYSFDPLKKGNGGPGYLYPRTNTYYGSGGGAGVAGPWSSDSNSGFYGQGGTNAGSGARSYTNPSSGDGGAGTNGTGGGGGGATWYTTTSGTNTTRISGAGGSGTVIFCYRYQ